MWSALRSGPFISGKDPLPIVQERGWASELLLDGRTNLAAPGFDLWTVQSIAICYTVYGIPTTVYSVGTEVNLVVQTDIRTLLPKRINNNADHYTRTCVVLFLTGTTTYSMGLPFFRGMTLRHWVIVSQHFETACPQPHGWICPPTWDLDISTLKNKDSTFFRNVGTRLCSDGISAIVLRNAQNTQRTIFWK